MMLPIKTKIARIQWAQYCMRTDCACPETVEFKHVESNWSIVEETLNIKFLSTFSNFISLEGDGIFKTTEYLRNTDIFN